MNLKSNVNLLPIYHNETFLNLIALWRNDPEIKKTLRSYKDISFDNQKDWVDKVNHSEDLYFYVMDSEKKESTYDEKAKYINTLLGYCGLDKIHVANRTSEISLMIAPKFQEKGYGNKAVALLLSKAFNEYNLELIHAETYFSKDFWIKCGFTLESTLRQRKYWNGQYHDSYILSINRKEFNKKYN